MGGAHLRWVAGGMQHNFAEKKEETETVNMKLCASGEMIS